jgi:hypothetical protein
MIGMVSYESYRFICISQFLQVDTFDSLAALFMGSWDERMGSGQWGDGPLGVLVTTIKAGSSESVAILSGLDIIISPSVDLDRPTHTSAPMGCLMPSEINLKVGLMTLVRKPSMDISIMTALLDLDSASVAEKDQDSDGDECDLQNEVKERERDSPLRVVSSKTNRAHFPHSGDDLSQALRAVIELDSHRGGLSAPEKSFPSFLGVGIGSTELSDAACGVATAPLLKVRFEASMAEISLSISADPTRGYRMSKGPYPCNGSSRNGSGKVVTTPLSRQLVKPFSLHYVSSLDLHPFLPSPPLTRPPSAYNREYYLTPNSSTISSSYLSVEGLSVNSSLLDLIRALHAIETTTHSVRMSRGYGLVFNPSPPPKVTPSDGLSTIEEDGSPLSPVLLTEHTVETQRALKNASISMFNSSNVDIFIVPASDNAAPAVLSLVTKFIHAVLERPRDAVAGSGGELSLGITPTGSSAMFTVHSPGGEGEGEERGEVDSVASSPDDWSDWICEDVALNAIATSGPAIAPAEVAQELSPNSPTTRQTGTLVKLVCGNLVLSANSSPLFYLLENSTARDALSQVTRSGLLGLHRRQQAAAGDGAPFLLIRCELSSPMPQKRLVTGKGEAESESHLKQTACSDSFTRMDGHLAGNAVDSQNSGDPRSAISFQIKAPYCAEKKSSTKQFKGRSSEGKRPGSKDADDERRMGQVVLLPQVFEGCLQGLLKELLEGFG